MKIERKTIGIIGAFNHPNFGDQLLFNILHGWIKDTYPGLIVRVPWGDPKGIQWPDDVLVGGGLKELLRCNVVVFGGGGYFGEPGISAIRGPNQYTRLDNIGMAMHLPKSFGGVYFGPKGYLRAETIRFIKYGLISKLLSIKKIPYCIIGTGLGPVTTCLGRWGVGSTLKGAEYVSLRDSESIKYAKAISPGLTIEECADIVLCNSVSINFEKINDINKVALHLGPKIERHLSIEFLMKIINDIRSMGLHVGLVSDCKPPEEGKISVFEKIYEMFGKEVEYIPYSGVDNFVKTLEKFDAVITTKLHSGILGYSKCVFPISVAEHVKTKRFYKQVGLETYCFELSEKGFGDALNGLQKIKSSPISAMESLNANRRKINFLALNNKSVLIDFINSHFVSR